MTTPRNLPALEGCLEPSDLARLVEVLTGPPGIAAFDADGTLWDGDVGEELVHFEALPPTRTVFAASRRKRASDELPFRSSRIS